MQVDHLFFSASNWQVALACYLGSTNNHYPEDPFLRFFEDALWTLPKMIPKNPIRITLIAFTDGPSKYKEHMFYIHNSHTPQKENKGKKNHTYPWLYSSTA